MAATTLVVVTDEQEREEVSGVGGRCGLVVILQPALMLPNPGFCHRVTVCDLLTSDSSVPHTDKDSLGVTSHY
jgi:hypothetical protein